MTSPAELTRLMAAALEDPRFEPDFLRALLEARLYVHRPLSDDSGRVRLIAFTRPDGLSVIPLFSDLEKAQLANRGGVTIMPVLGRELFESAQGATFMLNPNDFSMTLYPEEVSALRAGGRAVPALPWETRRQHQVCAAGRSLGRGAGPSKSESHRSRRHRAFGARLSGRR